MKLTIIALSTVLTFFNGAAAVAEIVTFTGSGIGPFSGAFRGGSVTATATGPTLIPGSSGANPNSSLFTFDPDQIVSITDSQDSGAAVDFLFSGETFGSEDYLFITNVGSERNIVLAARTGGLDVDAGWNISEAVGAPLVFNDDGSGINATISGSSNAVGGLLLRPSVSGFDALSITWTGNGFNNQGLQFGLVAVPEPSMIGTLASACVFLIVGRRLAVRRRSKNGVSAMACH